jgi:phosphomannomutase
LSELVDEMIDSYPSPGEINRAIEDPSKAIDRVLVNYKKMALSIDTTDGISMDFGNWRFNLRMSNTEPLVRLNIETRGDQKLLYQRRDEILKILDDT